MSSYSWRDKKWNLKSDKEPSITEEILICDVPTSVALLEFSRVKVKPPKTKDYVEIMWDISRTKMS